MAFIDHVKLFTDGCSRGNPGPASIGLVILDDDNQELHKHAECIGETTNNRAEYTALIRGLERCTKFTRLRVTCYTDSEFVCKQVNSSYRINIDELRKLCMEVKGLEKLFQEVVYTHVKRENPYIKRADRLANEILEGRGN